MPEAPEVAVIVNQLQHALLDEEIVQAWASVHRSYYTADAAQGRITGVWRHGKYIIMGLETDQELVVHLGMTGQLLLNPTHVLPHLKAQFTTASGVVLALNDPRGFGGCAVVEAGDYKMFSALAAKAPDILDDNITPQQLATRVQKGARPFKSRILDQKIVAGVGNYLADESLFLAGIHPATTTVSDQQALRWATAVQQLARLSFQHGGVSMRDYVHLDGSKGTFVDKLQVYGKKDTPCPVCGTPLVYGKVDGRGSTWCGVCQNPDSSFVPTLTI